MNVLPAFFVSLLLVVLFAPAVIRKLKAFQFGQSIREEGPASHQKKKGTPTIGGILFVPVVLASSVLFAGWNDPHLLLILYLTLGYGLIGFMDDFLKVRRKHNLGLSVRQKLSLQLLLFLGFAGYLYFTGFSTSVAIPGTTWSVDFGPYYYLFILFVVVGTTNSTNLTDGLDGLLSGIALIAFLAYAGVCYFYGFSSLSVLSLAFAGALLGFLFYNHPPAKLFMGDTGSLAIGGAFAGLAILTKTEFLLFMIGSVFVAETLSVMIQVISYKTRKKRVFKMTPLHHHFELSGWSEKKVVLKFWFAGLYCTLLGLAVWF